MKAKVKDTGEVVEVTPCSEPLNARIAFYKTEQGRMFPMFALEFEKEVDWEQRRYEIAKAAMQGRLTNQYGNVLVGKGDFKGVAVSAVKFADALIAELKEESAGVQNIQKNQRKEVQIGHIIEFCGEKYLCKEAREDQDCDSCDLGRDYGCGLPCGHCSAEYRDDGKDIIFQKL